MGKVIFLSRFKCIFYYKTKVMSKASYPLLTLCWEKNSRISSIKNHNKIPKNKSYFYFSSNFFPKPKIIDSVKSSQIIIGSPIIGKKINYKFSDNFLKKKELISSINGEFVIFLIEKSYDKITLINDRFASIPLYYFNNEKLFIVSTSYLEIIRLQKQKGIFSILTENFFEYIYFQRLLGDKTYDRITKFLNSSSYLQISRTNFINQKYWIPSFKKTFENDNQLVDKFSFLLQESVEKKMSDNKKFGLFLSGGFDSRSIAMTSKKKLKCVTYSFSDNFEVNCARKVAKDLNFEFYLHNLDKNIFSKNLDKINSLTQGMFTIDNALFIRPFDFKKNKIDVMLNGHGFDYLFQGMYLPSKFIKFFGRPTFFKKLLRYEPDISSQFLNQISFRLKYMNISEYLDSKYEKKFLKNLYYSCQQIEQEAKIISEKKEDIWEFFLIHNLGRHYSQPNLLTQKINVELRSPIFENNLFDFYLSLHPRHRLSARLFRKVLIDINKKVAMIESGNFGIALSASPMAKTFELIKRKILRHLTGDNKLRAPHAEDRTWPDRDRYIYSDIDFLKQIEQSLNSDILKDNLYYFDWKKINLLFDEFKSKKKSDIGGFFISLLSIKKFLEKI